MGGPRQLVVGRLKGAGRAGVGIGVGGASGNGVVGVAWVDGMEKGLIIMW